MVEDSYTGSGLFRRDVANAASRFRGVGLASADNVRYGEAEAGTGSRYAVAATWLPEDAARREGGSILVTVTAPWKAVMVVHEHMYLEASYAAEKLCAGRDVTHGGDLTALILLIGGVANVRVDPVGDFGAEAEFAEKVMQA